MSKTSQVQHDSAFDPTRLYETVMTDAKAGAAQVLAVADRMEAFAIAQAAQAIDQSAQLGQTALREAAAASKAWRALWLGANGTAQVEAELMRLTDLQVIVTGAGSGMGSHFARRLVEAGARVCAADLDLEALLRLEASCAGLPGRLHTVKLDVTQEASVAETVAFADEVLGGVNALINSAGIIKDGLLVRRDRNSGEITTLGLEQWRQVLDVNLTGTALMLRDVAASMARHERRPGVIVNMSSVARHGNRGQGNYVASKAAIAANTVTWARELAPFGIRVTAIAPGMVETPMTRGMNQKARDALVAQIPVGRIAEPEDIWLAARFCLECDYFNGRVLDVDGGLVM